MPANNADDSYPKTVIGRIILAVFAVIGLALAIWVLIAYGDFSQVVSWFSEDWPKFKLPNIF